MRFGEGLANDRSTLPMGSTPSWRAWTPLAESIWCASAAEHAARPKR